MSFEEMERDLELGKSIIRSEGINFTVFKTRVSAMLEGREASQDMWVMLYQDYAELRAHYRETPEDWAEMHFQDFTIEKHGYQLKNKK